MSTHPTASAMLGMHLTPDGTVHRRRGESGNADRPPGSPARGLLGGGRLRAT
jgi:hypothetical protein